MDIGAPELLIIVAISVMVLVLPVSP